MVAMSNDYETAMSAAGEITKSIDAMAGEVAGIAAGIRTIADYLSAPAPDSFVEPEFRGTAAEWAALPYDMKAAAIIIRWSYGDQLPELLLLPMLIHESGGALDPNIERHTADEDSYGIIQINARAHSGDPAQWLGYTGIERSMNEMHSRWQTTFNNLGSWSAWIADPVRFLVTFAPMAQGSDAWTYDLAARRFGQALQIYVQFLKTRPAREDF